MDKKTIESYKITVKKMVSFAKTLVKNELPVIYELGHYLADNVLSKVSMIILAEKNRPDLIFKNGKSGRTLDFPELYKNMQQKFFTNINEYDEIVKEFHADRSMYQHRFESLKMTIRQPEAEKFVDFVIETMRETGILGKTESLPYIKNMNGSLVTNESIINSRQNQYQDLYDLLKNPQMKDVIIAINNKLDYDILDNLRKDLIMEISTSRLYSMLINSDWHIEKIRGVVYLKKIKTKEQFSYIKPKVNLHVLEDFLSYFREKLKEKGIIIKE